MCGRPKESAEDNALDNYCFIIATTACCKECCLMKHFHGDSAKATNFVQTYFAETEGMSRKERRDHIKQKISSSIVEYEPTGRALHAWRVGEAPEYFIQNVCHFFSQTSYSDDLSFVDNVPHKVSKIWPPKTVCTYYMYTVLYCCRITELENYLNLFFFKES